MTARSLSWLDDEFTKDPLDLQDHGSVATKRKSVNFSGSLVVTDDPTNDRTNVSVTIGPKVVHLDAASPAVTAGTAAAPLPSDPLHKVTKGTPTAALAAGAIAGIFGADAAPDTDVIIYPPGSTVPAALFPEVATMPPVGTRALAQLGATGRPVKKAVWSGGEIRVGVFDATGNLTVDPSVPVNATPRHEFNVVTYGAVADCSPLTGRTLAGGTATDNVAAFQACEAAIAAAAQPRPMRVPAGPVESGVQLGYRMASTYSPSAKGLEIIGEGGDGWADVNASQLIFDPTIERNLVLCQIGMSSGLWDRVGITQPQANAPQNWKIGVNLTTDCYLIPSAGGYGFVFHCLDNLNVPINGTEPPCLKNPSGNGKEWDIGSIVDRSGVFENNDTIYQEITDTAKGWDRKPIRFKAGSIAGAFGLTAVIPELRPYHGDAPIIATGVAYNAGDAVRPPNANWNDANGSYFVVTVGGTLTTLPSAGDYSGASGTNQTFTHNGVTFQNKGPCFPRDTGLGTPDNQVTWTVDDTTATETDTTSRPGTTVHWEVKTACHGLQVGAVMRVRNSRIYNTHGDGCLILASGSSGSAGNGVKVDRLTVIANANNGFKSRGADASMGHFTQINSSGNQRAHIEGDSFLGDSFKACQITPNDFNFPGRFGYRATGSTGCNHFDTCYTEGGTAQSRITSNNRVTNRTGIWTFTPGSAPAGMGGFALGAPQQIASTSYGRLWRALTPTFAGEFIVPGNGYRYQVLSSTNGSGGPGVSSSSEPTWSSHVTIAGTSFTETSGANVITYQCVGTSGATQTLGDVSNNPEKLHSWKADHIANSLDLFSDPAVQGLYGFCRGGIRTLYLGLDFDVVNGVVILGKGNDPGFVWGGGGFQRSVRFIGTTAPATGAAGDIAIATGETANGSYPFRYCTATNTYVRAGKNVNTAQEIFDVAGLRWAGDASGGSSTLPATDSKRGEVQTTDATQTTAHTIAATTSGTHYSVAVKVVAKRTDVVGDFATFLLKGSWLNNAGTLVADAGGPAVIEGQPTDANHQSGAGASTWAAVLDTSGTNIRVRVTGQAAKTIHWSIVREQVEAT